MKFFTDNPVFPYQKVFWISLGLIVIAALFASPTAPPFEYTETVNAEVIAVRVLSPNPPQIYRAELRFDDGSQAFIKVPSSFIIRKGSFIAVDRYEMDGKKPRYQLSQDPGVEG